MPTTGQIKNRCPECIGWNGSACKYGIAGQYRCDRWSYDYARLLPSALGGSSSTESVDTAHRTQLYGGN